jgi:ubiquinone/menaquinone biosynthesis C-methylase UbiE
MKVSNDFNAIAAFYDPLSTFIFRQSMTRAQTFFLEEVPPGASVLMLGGGTGWLLAKLLRLNLTCTVSYIEASSKMLGLSMNKISAAETKRVNFIHGTEDSIPSHIVFDVVITPFFLDLFVAERGYTVVEKVRRCLHSKGIWLVTDFMNTAWWHSAMLYVMYRFFKTTAHLEASKLPDWEIILKRNGLTELKSRFFYSGFIKSVLAGCSLEAISQERLLTEA